MSSRPLTLSAVQTVRFIDEFIENEGATIAQVALSHLFRVYPELENPCLAQMSNPSASMTKRVSTILENYGILLAPDRVQSKTTMIAAGLRLYVEQKSAVISDQRESQGSSAVNRINQSLEEWADDLAVISKSRNILEKRLRQVVLNFIRVDVLADKSKGTVKARILQVTPSDQRNKYDHLGADDIIEKYNWSELSALIKKEWRLFQGVFADKNQFELQSSMINDRPDAHAKSFDVADFALYRRALKWLSDSIQTL